MPHFIVRMISTSTEKEEEHEGELIGTDVERGFIDFTRAGRLRGYRFQNILGYFPHLPLLLKGPTDVKFF
jgi:hypothetical protein